MPDGDKQIYHANHNDPDADLVLECEDGVRLRVHSYLLKAHSEYFRNMPPHTDGIVGDGSKVVHLDCFSSDFALLLGLINKSRDANKYAWYELERIINIGKRFHFLHIPDLVRHPASHCITFDNADTVFKFASSHHFFDLAKIAIARFACQFDCSDYADMPLYVCDNIPGRYGAALIRAIAANPYIEDDDLDLRWGRISAAFNVIEHD